MEADVQNDDLSLPEIEDSGKLIFDGIYGSIESTSLKVGSHVISFTDTSKAWNELLNQLDESDTMRISQLTEHDHENTSENTRTTLMKLPDHVTYKYEFSLRRKRVCSLCRDDIDNSCDVDEVFDCRVCGLLFHSVCVYRRSSCNERMCVQFDREVGWSCPECDDVFSLLKEEEKEEIEDLYAAIAGEDKVIDIDEFIGQRKEEYRKLVDSEMTVAREELEREMFHAIDQDNSGFIDRWEFYPYMAIRYLSRRKSSDIIGILTPREVDCFRQYFKSMDVDNVGSVRQTDARRAYVGWYTSKVRACQDMYVDYTWYGGPKENTLLVALKMKLSSTDENNTKSIEQNDHEVMISWEQYLRICALHIVSARINTVTKRPKIPPMPIYLYSHSACMCYLEDQM